VDVVLAPGLAVDRRGVRLGRGAGYYDRALAAVRAPVAVLLYDAELVEEDLPAEPHDRPVTAVVTPLRGWVNLS
jgi:5-formyltetrahydrofolate cyclo-ligase